MALTSPSWRLISNDRNEHHQRHHRHSDACPGVSLCWQPIWNLICYLVLLRASCLLTVGRFDQMALVLSSGTPSTPPSQCQSSLAAMLAQVSRRVGNKYAKAASFGVVAVVAQWLIDAAIYGTVRFRSPFNCVLSREPFYLLHTLL